MTEEAQKASFSLETLPWYAVPAALLGVPALVAILATAWPEVFFDQFVAKYYWHPIRDDTGYNPVNTLTWAALLGLCLVGLTQIITALKAKMNNAIILGATAWVVVGSIFRVMEDVRMFEPPLKYFMITPPIYLLFGAFGVSAFLIANYIKPTVEAKGIHEGLQKLWLIEGAFVLFYTLLWAAKWSQIVVYLHPLHVVLFAVIQHAVIRWWVMRKNEYDPRDLVMLLAIAPFLMGLDYVYQFISDPWIFSRAGIPSSFVTAPLLAAALTGVVWASARAARIPEDQAQNGYYVIGAFALALVALLFYVTGAAATLGSVGGLLVVAAVLTAVGVLVARKMRANATEGEPTITMLAYLAPINLVLIFSQLVDGFATSLGIDLAQYEEKQVLSAYLIDAFREASIAIGWEFGATYPTFLAFVPVKLAVSVLVVYAIDVHSREDVEKYPTLIGFVKFAIIMVGLGPGVRDFVRLSLGV